jgi:hypothetical protein
MSLNRNAYYATPTKTRKSNATALTSAKDKAKAKPTVKKNPNKTK